MVLDIKIFNVSMNPAYSEPIDKEISWGTNKQLLAFQSTTISLHKNSKLAFELEMIHFWSLLKLQSFTQSVWPSKTEHYHVHH